MNDDEGWTDGAVRCFLSYQTKDSRHWSDLGPRWAERIKAWLEPDYPEGVHVFEYADSGNYVSGNWPELLRRRVRSCEIFIALVTDHYLDRNQRAIAIELGEIKEREGRFVPILITQNGPDRPHWDPALTWVLDQNACPIKNFSEFGSDGKTPSFPPYVGKAIAVTLKRVRPERVLKGSSLQAQPVIEAQPDLASVLGEVYTSVGRTAPVSLPAGLSQLPRGTGSQDHLHLWPAVEELAVLMDEHASDEVIQAWAKRFLA